MIEFMALRLKLYAYKMLNGSGDKKCKKVKKCVIKKTVDLEDYKQCPFACKKAFWKQLLFQNRLHEVNMVEVTKLALSRNNKKPVIQSNCLSTLAHGHKNTPKNEPKNFASGILQWSGFGKMTVTMRKVDVEKNPMQNG